MLLSLRNQDLSSSAALLMTLSLRKSRSVILRRSSDATEPQKSRSVVLRRASKPLSLRNQPPSSSAALLMPLSLRNQDIESLLSTVDEIYQVTSSSSSFSPLNFSNPNFFGTSSISQYSDSEKDLSAKDRKDSGGSYGARVSSEKRKLDLKEGKESGNDGGE